MTTYNGYTYEVPELVRKENLYNTVCQLAAENPGNSYWQEKLAQLRSERADADRRLYEEAAAREDGWLEAAYEQQFEYQEV